MIIEHNNGLRERHTDLTAEEVLQKTAEALDDPTIKAIETYKQAPRWQRRQWDREARRTRGKRRTYR